jgi:hypothetical protein
MILANVSFKLPRLISTCNHWSLSQLHSWMRTSASFNTRWSSMVAWIQLGGSHDIWKLCKSCLRCVYSKWSSMGTISEAFRARNSHCRALNCDSLFSEEASLWTTDCTALRRSSKLVAIAKFQAAKGLGTMFCVWTESFLSEHQNLHLLQSLCECIISGSKPLHTPRCVCTTDHVRPPPQVHCTIILDERK